MELIIAIVGSAVAIVGVVMAMMFWCRQEANSLGSEAKEDRRDFLQAFKGLEMAVYEMKAESKDFHYGLLEIERARK